MDRRSIWANAHGGVAVISAFGAALACLAAAIAVDLGALALHARKVQGAADLAALAAAQRLDGADAAEERIRCRVHAELQAHRGRNALGAFHPAVTERSHIFRRADADIFTHAERLEPVEML